KIQLYKTPRFPSVLFIITSTFRLAHERRTVPLSTSFSPRDFATETISGHHCKRRPNLKISSRQFDAASCGPLLAQGAIAAPILQTISRREYTHSEISFLA